MKYRYIELDNYKTYGRFSRLRIFGAPGKLIFELIRVIISFFIYMILICTLGFHSVITIIAVVVFMYYVLKLMFFGIATMIILIFYPTGTIDLFKRVYIYLKTGKVTTSGYEVEVDVR